MTTEGVFRKPLATDPAFVAARELVASGGLGQVLAVYAVTRAKEPLADPLTVLGLPLLEEIIGTLDEQPASVTAVMTGESGGLEHWSLVVAFPFGVRATVDLGAGLGPAQAGALDLRVEWSGGERVVLVDPANVAVTVTNEGGAHRRSAEVSPIAAAVFAFADRALDIAANPPPAWRSAAAIVDAARGSAASGTRVDL